MVLAQNLGIILTSGMNNVPLSGTQAHLSQSKADGFKGIIHEQVFDGSFSRVGLHGDGPGGRG